MELLILVLVLLSLTVQLYDWAKLTQLTGHVNDLDRRLTSLEKDLRG